MLDSVFFRILRMSASAAWLALAVMVLRALMKRVPRRIVLLLWVLVALRLVFPLSIEWRFSLVPRPETLVQSAQTAVLPAAAPAAPDGSALSMVWLAGAAAMLLWGFWNDLRLRRRVRVSLPMGENIRLCDAIATPFVLGVLRPRIYLPSAIDADAAAYVLAHERAHIARRDHWWKPLGWLLLSVYWFHPLLWASYALFCRDLEFACDERAAAPLDRAGRAAYSDALLRCSVRRGALSSPVAFGETGVKARVRAVLQGGRFTRRGAALALVTVFAVGVLFLTDQPAMALQPSAEPAPLTDDGDLQEYLTQKAIRPETPAPTPSAMPTPSAVPIPSAMPQAAVRSAPEPVQQATPGAESAPSAVSEAPAPEPTLPPAPEIGGDIVDSGGF